MCGFLREGLVPGFRDPVPHWGRGPGSCLLQIKAWSAHGLFPLVNSRL